MATTNEAKLFSAIYRQADDETRQLGADWYPKARAVARSLARKHKVTQAQAAGVIAAISPRMRWSANIRYADAILAGVAVRGIFAHNLAKAERIMQGERPLDVLGGDKVRAFYKAIQGDRDSVVIDVWMLRSVEWEKKSLTSREYERVAQALTEAAQAAGVDPRDFQAIVWTQVRGGAE